MSVLSSSELAQQLEEAREAYRHAVGDHRSRRRPGSRARRSRRASRCGGRRGSRSCRRVAGSGTPRIRKPSSVANTCWPSARRASTVASTRSDSFARSSSAPRSRLLPCAHEAASANSGSSSIASGTSSAENRRRDELGRAHLEIADALAADAAPVVDGHAPAHPLQDRQQAGAARIEVDAVDVELRARHERGGDDERRRRGEVAGHLDVDRLQPLGRLDRDALLAPRDRARRPPRASARCGRASAAARRPSSRPWRRGRRGGSPTSPARSRPAARR